MNSLNKIFSVSPSISQQNLSCRVVSKREKEISLSLRQRQIVRWKRGRMKKEKKRNKNLSVFEADTSEEHILERRNSF